MNQKIILIILDGWGINPNPKVSAIAQANTPFINSCYQNYPNAELTTFGLQVGLPEGQMGNSEVGHMNLGAGRIVYQNLVKINNAVTNKTLIQEKVLLNAFSHAKKNQKKVHFIGLLSNGGVHSHINHLKGLLDAAKEFGLNDNVYVHAFTDGRDCDPYSSKNFIAKLTQHMQKTTGKLASIVGRYYAMDRDKRWERIKLAYDAMVNAKGVHTQNIIESIEKSYQNNISDEFLLPHIIQDKHEQPIAKIEAGDVVINFNFRTDRGREITEVLTQKDYVKFNMKTLPIYYVTMTRYDENYKNVNVIYDEEVLQETLGEILEKHNKTQIRIAETEKYPHVTFFFSGGREQPFKGESRILCPSPKDVPTYDLKPEMSANEITHKIIPEIEKETADFICLNFANTDMVGHTGDFKAAIKAAETVDTCTQQIVETAQKHNYDLIILADHGNADVMVNKDGSPNTQHSNMPVPIILIEKNKKHTLKNGKLGDVAPTILTLMNIPIPNIMNGDVLVQK